MRTAVARTSILRASACKPAPIGSHSTWPAIFEKKRGDVLPGGADRVYRAGRGAELPYPTATQSFGIAPIVAVERTRESGLLVRTGSQQQI